MICFVLFRNGHFHNVILTFANVVKLDVKNDNVVLTLSNVFHIYIEMCNIESTLFDFVDSIVVVSRLIWHCLTSRRHISQKTTLKKRWNVCSGVCKAWKKCCLVVLISVRQLHMCLKQSLNLWRNLTLLNWLNFSRSLVRNFTPIWSCIENKVTIMWKTGLTLIWNAW